MLNDFRQINKGAHIERLHTGNPTYADDVSLATLHKPLLQYYLNRTYSQRWCFDFNPTKSVVIIFGDDICTGQALSLGGSDIPVMKGDLA